MGVGLVPHLVVGIGGQGITVLNKIKKIALQEYIKPDEHSNVPFPLVEYLGIDSTLQDLAHDEVEMVLDPKSEILTVDISKAKEVFNKAGQYSKQIQELINDQDIIDIVREKFADITEGCGGYPLLCRVAMALDVKTLRNVLEKKLINLTAIDRINEMLSKGNYLGKYGMLDTKNLSLNIYIINSLSGGTGRGIYEVVSLVAKSVASELINNSENVKLKLFTFMPSIFSYSGKDISYAYKNTYAGVKEIDSFLEGNYSPEEYLIQSIGGKKPPEYPIDFLVTVGGVNSTADGRSAGPSFTSIDEARTRFARFVCDSIFTGTSSWALGKISNLSNILSKKVIERSTGKERNRRYMRVLYSSLVLPVEDLFRYLSIKLKYDLTLDLLAGTLSIPEDARDIRNQERIIEGIESDIKSYRLMPDVKKPEEYHYYANVDRVKSELEEFQSNILREVETSINNMPRYAREFVENFRNKYATKIVQAYGLEGLERILDEIISFLKKRVAEGLGKTTLTMDIVEDLVHVEKKIEDLLDNIEKSVDSSQREIFKVFSKYEGLFGSLKKLLRFGRLNNEDVEFIRRKIDELYSNVKDIYLKNINNFLNQLYLMYILREFENYRDIIHSEIEIVKKYKHKLDTQLMDIEKKNYGKDSIKLILNNRQEGEIIFNAILSYLKESSDDKLDYLEFFDRNFMDSELYREHIAQYDKSMSLDYESALDKTLGKLARDFESILNEKLEKSLKTLYIILKYIGQDSESLKAEIKRILEEPISKLYFWGSINISEEKGAGTQFRDRDTLFIRVLFPKDFSEEANDSKAKEMASELQARIREIMSAYFSPDFGILDEAFPNDRILVIGYHAGLSAFVFDDLQRARNEYMTDSDEERKLRHIKPEFVYLPEPIDISESIDDFYYLLNIAYQIRAIKGNIFKSEDIEKLATLVGNRIEYKPWVVEDISGREVYIRNIEGQDFPLARVIESLSTAIIEKFLYLLGKYKIKSKDIRMLQNFVAPSSSFRNQKEKVIPFPPGLINRLKAALEEYSITDNKRALLDDWLNKYSYKYSQEAKNDKSLKLTNRVYTHHMKQKAIGLYVFPYE